MKKLFFLLTVGISFLYSMLSSHAQISLGGQPLSLTGIHALAQTDKIPVVVMPYVDVEALKAEDRILDTYSNIPWRFGQNIEVDIDLKRDGMKEILSTGDYLYRIIIQSQGALSINLLFDHFQIPDGATLFIYTPGYEHVHGAFTSFHNQADSLFATTLIQGDKIILEYFEPANVTFPGILHISRVTHAYRGPHDFAKAFGQSGSCNVNVACPQSAGMENQIRSVCMLVTGGNGFCSGALINNTAQDGKPYVLSANHCYSTPGAVVYWFNWQSPTCSNPPTSPPYNSISGATDRARNTASDFWLVELNQAIPSSYNVYFSGWNRTTDNYISGKVWGIHHPSGDIKKISWSLLGVSTTTYLQNTVPGDGTHWRITNWSDGTTTEGGSSGSPLFDPQGRIIGQLHGGYASCTSITSDWYGKLGVSWNGGGTAATRLRDWLDPLNTGVMTLDGFDPNVSQFDLDVQLLNILIPEDTYCSTNNITPQVTIKNLGTQNLISATVSYVLNNATPVSINWTGNLSQGQTAVVTFPAISLTSGLGQTFQASVTNPNNGTDQQPSNNMLTKTFSVYGIPTLPFFEGFENQTFAPVCWLNQRTAGTSNPGTWDRVSTGTYPTCSPFQGTAMARFNSYTYASGTAAILVSRQFDVLPNIDVLSFYMYRDNGYPTRLDRVNVYINSSQSLTGATLLGTIHRSRSQSPVVSANGWYKYEFTVPTGVSGPQHFILQAIGAGGNNIFIDNFEVVRTQTCFAPTGLTATNITSNGAELSWSQAGTAMSWDIALGLTGFNFTGIPTDTNVPNPYFFTNLSPNTSYSYYVRAKCASNFYSSWAGPYTFTTQCAAIMAPFIENFEVVPPECWTVSSSTSQNWGISSSASAFGIGTRSAMAQFYSFQNPAPFYLYSPVFDASGLTNPALRFHYAYATYTSEVDQLNIYISSDGGNSFTLLQSLQGGVSGILNTGGVVTSAFVPAGSQWNTFEIALPQGVNMIAFEAVSAYGNNLFIDNVEIFNQPQQKTLQLYVFLEGLYLSPGQMNEAIGDTGPQFGQGIADVIDIELRDTIDPNIVHFQFSNIELLTNGQCIVNNLPNSVSNNYYIVVKHRNSIETWSALPVSFAGTWNVYYNFASLATQAYGANLKPVNGGYFVIWGGNANADGIVDIEDMSLVENASRLPQLTGYHPQDINGDGVVDLIDMSIVENNSVPPPVSVKRP